MDLKQLTVVIPTRNEQQNIERFIRSLPDNIALVVVDASTDATPEVIMALRPQSTQIIRHPGHIATARQVGAEYAHTRWLLFTDADVVFDTQYFERLRAMDEFDITLGAVYGTKVSSTEFMGYHRWFAAAQGLFARLGIPAATGSNMLVSRKAFYHVGGFDVSLPCNEDSEIIWRIKRAHYEVRFESQLSVTAIDHRRLRRSVTRKVLHSSARCLMLYFDLLPSAWRSRDWGYWSTPHQASAQQKEHG